MMNQWDNIKRYEQAALDSAGGAMEKFGAYQDSIEGKMEGMKNQFQQLSTTIINTDLFGGLIDGGTGFLGILDSIIGKVGVIPTLIGGNFIKGMIGQRGNFLETGILNKTALMYGGSRQGILDFQKYLPKFAGMNVEDGFYGFKDYLKSSTLSDRMKSEIGDEFSSLFEFGKKGQLKLVDELEHMGDAIGVVEHKMNGMFHTATVGMSKMKVAASGFGTVLAAVGKQALIMGAIFVAFKAGQAIYDSWVTSQTKATRAMDEFQKANERTLDSQKHLDGLNDRMSEVQSRWSQLNAMDTLTIVEEAELDKLTRLKQELQGQIDFQERLVELNEKLEGAEAEKFLSTELTHREIRDLAEKGGYSSTVLKRMNEVDGLRTDGGNLIYRTEWDSTGLKSDAEWNEYQRQIGQIRADVSEHGNTFGGVLRMTADMAKEARIEYDKYLETADPSNTEKNTKAFDDYNNVIKQHAHFLNIANEQLRAMRDEEGNLRRGFTAETYDKLWDDIYYSNTIDMSPAEKLNLDLERLFSRASLSNTIKNLKELAQARKNVGEALTYKDVRAANIDLEQYGLTSLDVARHLNQITNAAIDTSDAFQTLGESMSNLMSFEDLSEAFKTPNMGDNYVAMHDLLKRADELKRLGLVGTDDFLSIAEFISPTKTHGRIEHFGGTYETDRKKLDRYFTFDDSGAWTNQGIINALDDLVSAGFAYKDSEGFYNLTKDLKNSAQAAEALEIAIGPMEMILKRFSDFDNFGDMFNFDFSFSGDLAQQFEHSLQAIRELHQMMEDGPTKDALGEKILAWQYELDSFDDTLSELTKEQVIQISFEYSLAELQVQLEMQKKQFNLLGGMTGKDVTMDQRTEHISTLERAKTQHEKIGESKGIVSIPAKVDLEVKEAELREQLNGYLSDFDRIQVMAQLANNLELQNELQNLFNNVEDPVILAELNTMLATADMETFLNWANSLTLEELIQRVKRSVDNTELDKPIPDARQRVQRVTIGGIDHTSSATGTMTGFSARAYAGGTNDVTIGSNQKALVNELGTESIVRNGRWFSIPPGPRLFDLKKGDIVFNHKQTEQLMRHGRVLDGSKGQLAYADGTVPGGTVLANAYSRINPPNVSSSTKSSTSSSNATRNTNAKNNTNNKAQQADDALKKLAEVFDFIEIRVSELARQTKRAERLIEQAVSLADAQAKTSTTMSKVLAEIEVARAGINEYERHAQLYASQSGLSAELQQKVRDGSINVNQISEDDRTRVNEFKTWIDKMKGLQDSIDDLIEKERELAKQRLKHIEDFYRAVNDVQGALKSVNDSRLNLIDAIGGSNVSSEVVGIIQDSLTRQDRMYQESLKQLGEYQNEFNSLVRQGYIKEGQLAYHEGQQKIAGLSEAANRAAIALLETQRQLREIDYRKLQNVIDTISSGINRLTNGQTLREARGDHLSRQDYQNQINEQSKFITAQNNLRNTKLQEMNRLSVDSAQWKALEKEVSDIADTITGALIKIEDLKDRIFAEEFRAFDERMSDLRAFASELDAMQGLLNSDAFFSKTGELTGQGAANISLIARAMGNARTQTASATEALRKLDGMLTSGLISQDEYKTKQRDLLDIIQNSAIATESYRQEILDLAKAQVESENTALKKNIDLRKRALDNQKAYWDYAKSLKQSNRDIAGLEAQIAALQGVNNSQALSELKRLQAQLEDAREAQDDMKRQHSFDMQNKGYDRMNENLDKFFEDFQYSILHNIDVQEQVISDMLNRTVSMYASAYGEIANIISRNGLIGSTDFNQAIDQINNQQQMQTIANQATQNQSTVKADLTATNINTNNAVNTNHASVENAINQAPQTANRLVVQFDLSKTIMNLMVGQSDSASATFVPGDAANRSLTWASNNTSVATVSNGTVRAVGAGGCTITARTNDGSNLTRSIAVQVTAPPPPPPPPAPPTPPAPTQQTPAQPQFIVGSNVRFTGRYTADSFGGGASGAMGANGEVLQIIRVVDQNRPRPFAIGRNGVVRGWVSKAQLYNRGTRHAKSGLAFIDDLLEGGLDYGSEALMTNRGALVGLEGGESVFTKAQTQKLHEISDRALSNSMLSDLDSANVNLYTSKEFNVQLEGPRINIEGNVTDEKLHEMKKILEESYRYTSDKLLKELKKLR